MALSEKELWCGVRGIERVRWSVHVTVCEGRVGWSSVVSPK
jgi:hypothetical protein